MHPIFLPTIHYVSSYRLGHWGSVVLLQIVHQINHFGLAHRRAHSLVCFIEDPGRKDDPKTIEEEEIEPAEYRKLSFSSS
jgi:hypothetical protein